MKQKCPLFDKPSSAVRGNQTRAAELLGISRDQLRYRLKKLEEARGLTADSEA